eukprot:CAMPEP_0205804460 /NCGR_PEP_ID=MMETSP0205-20121125/7384_1 /ASSEMBLY_ACC=CAM_ASM_000278 /TAXON_ID=36767 /ORGANISM="Euplotes focardii, Strain TN1" /LENGTH=198 /DNA_ID=CAMNT_0053074101 /DNA_START=339 /DNA_END=935 /DNA_ORIENTATION=-
MTTNEIIEFNNSQTSQNLPRFPIAEGNSSKSKDEKIVIPAATFLVTVKIENEKEIKDIGSESIKKRWGRDQDKTLFIIIRQMEKEGELSLQEITSMNAKDEACSNIGVNNLAKKFQWKSLKKYLVLRIQSLCKKGFSVRETKKLKRIIKKDYKYLELDYERILDNFPGKNIALVKEVCAEIMKSRDDKTLTNYCLRQK